MIVIIVYKIVYITKEHIAEAEKLRLKYTFNVIIIFFDYTEIFRYHKMYFYL